MCFLSVIAQAGNVQANETKVETVRACVPFNRSNDVLMNQLQWANNGEGLCGGAYKTHTIAPVSGFQLTADDLNLALSGRSTVRGKVRVKHEDKELSADLAHTYRQDDKVTKVELIGNVIFEEPAHRMLASKGEFDVQNYSGTLEDVLYRLLLVSDEMALLKQVNPLTAWGQSCNMHRDGKGNLTLNQVSYSTCPPGFKFWHLKADKLTLLKKESKGVARKAVLYIKNTPVFYVPYISFPLDTKRKSGFLGSKMAMTSQNGFDYRVPYYLNLSPNMDATLYPHYLSRRGLMMGGEFRYLFERDSGLTQAHLLMGDKAFKTFKQSNLWLAPQLATLSDNRYSIKWLHNSQLTKDLDLHIDLETVSDDYYLQDFNHNLSMVGANQLLRQASLNYQTEHWNYKAVLQDHQTLHPFNQSTILGVYARFPSLTALGAYRDLPFNLLLTMLGQFDNFVWQGDDSLTKPQGERYHFAPTLSLLKRFYGGYVKPALTLNSSHYSLKHYNNQQNTVTRLLPVSSIDMGLLFDKPFVNKWRQTLEPRLLYLYVPYAKQFDVPMFDSGYLFPSYDELFRTNRFAGFDRIGDANRLSMGLKSRFIDASGTEQLVLSVGGAYKFKKERVFGCQNFEGIACNDSADRVGYVSSQVGLGATQIQADVTLSNHLNVLSSIAYDLPGKKVNNAMVNFHYEPKPNHIINAGYGFVLNGDPTQLTNVAQPDINLHQIRLSYAWPYNAHWRSIGAWSYNVSHSFAASYLLGLQYDDCCVALRLLGGRTYLYYSAMGGPTYGNNVYLQVLFKGLGSASNSDPKGEISNFLPTFKDEF